MFANDMAAAVFGAGMWRLFGSVIDGNEVLKPREATDVETSGFEAAEHIAELSVGYVALLSISETLGIDWSSWNWNVSKM